MIFFSIPSVGQLKPETLFGEDDHYGFIQTLIGEEYNRAEVSSKCTDYYQTLNEGYWDRIITIVNFLGLKKIDSHNRLVNIPLLDFIVEKYDEGSQRPAQILFDYLLCQWQFPHPIVTRTTAIHALDITTQNPRYNFPIIKPYNLFLSILRNLYNNDPKSAYFTKEEFYWLGYSYYRRNGVGFDINSIQNLCDDLLDVRLKGWDLYREIKDRPETSTHLSYPLGFIRNSAVLTDKGDEYRVNQSLFYFGLKTIPDIIQHVDSLIDSSTELYEFKRNTSNRDNKLINDYSTYLYNNDRFKNWLNNVEIYSSDRSLFINIEEEELPEETDQIAKIKATIQLKRLSDLDKLSTSRRRTEQFILRNYLLGGQEFGNCAICNKQLPISFLATAHIKKRSNCSDDEKRDLHIVMPTCYLGCDKIFEDGYVVVKEGKIASNYRSKPITPVLKNYIDCIEGEECAIVNELNLKYFDFHRSINELR